MGYEGTNEKRIILMKCSQACVELEWEAKDNNGYCYWFQGHHKLLQSVWTEVLELRNLSNFPSIALLVDNWLVATGKAASSLFLYEEGNDSDVSSVATP
uniref:(California timema) hypothetical protein n=1 Tax=Timema californicum TaxID=61474 RepID=A0A7R9J7C3_TIMCA|nr:unnamed protein product [Timema californicum]